MPPDCWTMLRSSRSRRLGRHCWREKDRNSQLSSHLKEVHSDGWIIDEFRSFSRQQCLPKRRDLELRSIVQQSGGIVAEDVEIGELSIGHATWASQRWFPSGLTQIAPKLLILPND